MKLKQTRIITTLLAFFTVTTMFASLLPATVFAVGTTCLDNPPSTDGTCKQRDTSKDTVSTADTPVKNDGSAVTDWTCSKGTFNSTKHTCETCNGFGNCQAAGVNPTPKGNDTTVDPNASTGTNGTTSTAGSGGKGTCAGVKTDYFACSGNGSEAISGLLTQIILIVSVGVGIVAIGGVVYAGTLYASAQDNQDQVRKSVNIIKGVGIGIILYVLMVAIINFLVPGGVFNTPAPTTNSPATNTSSSNTPATNTPSSTTP